MPQNGAAVPIRDCFTAVENAWAQWRKATEKATFAAVMGYALPHGVRQDSASIASELQNDWVFEQSFRIATHGVSMEDAGILRRSIEDHIEWPLEHKISAVDRLW